MTHQTDHQLITLHIIYLKRYRYIIEELQKLQQNMSYHMAAGCDVYEIALLHMLAGVVYG